MGSDYWSKWTAPRSRLSRRQVLRAGALGGAGLVGAALIGCRAADDAPAAPGATPRPGTTPAVGATPTPSGEVVGQPVKGGVTRGIFLGGNVFDSVDVHRAFGDPSSWLSNFVLNKVVRYANPDTGEIEGDLAETFETPDAQTYTFKIRNDVKWQDTPATNGRQLTAEDIKWHFERQAAGQLSDGTVTPFRHQTFYQSIVNLDMPDEFTLRVTLDNPNGTFLDRLAAYFSTVPNRETMEKFEADHRTLVEEAMPATGPYTLKQWRAGEDIKLERYPDYFRKDEVNLDGWIYPMGLFEDPTALRAAFEQKQVDFFSSPDPSLTKAIIEANRGNMYEVLTGVANTVFLHLNMNQQFKDLRHVRAVNLAFDRRGAIQTFHQGLGQVSGAVTWLQEGFALPGDELISYEGYGTNRDDEIKNARDLWAAADGASLGEINIKIPDTWLGPWPDTTQVIPSMLNQAIGGNQFISTRTTYNEEIIPNLANGTFPNWFAWTSQVSGPDPRAGLRSTYHSASTANFQKVDNPELDKLVEDALLTADYEQAVELSRQAQRIILENGQYGNVVLYNYISRSAGWSYFFGNQKVRPTDSEPGQGYNIFAGHLSAKNSWLDPSHPSYQGRANVTL
jgi:peptide/nickel transport system substrate-binding protein